MLIKDPVRRISAKDALGHAWFNTEVKNVEILLPEVIENIANFNEEMPIDPR